MRALLGSAIMVVTICWFWARQSRDGLRAGHEEASALPPPAAALPGRVASGSAIRRRSNVAQLGRALARLSEMAAAAPGQGSLVVNVHDLAGSPIQDVKVWLVLDDGQAPCAYSNDDGAVAFSGLAPGDGLVLAVAAGRRPVIQEHASIRGGTTGEVMLVMDEEVHQFSGGVFIQDGFDLPPVRDAGPP
jgi:hypothetical protein